MTSAPTLRDYLPGGAAPGAISVLLRLADAAGEVARLLAGSGSNAALARAADAAFAGALAGSGIRFLASLPRDAIAKPDPDGDLALVIDPLSPAAIEVNAPLGTFFSLYPAAATAEASFLRPGTDQIAAGCFLYGLRTTVALSTGRGAALLLRDNATSQFFLHCPELRIPSGTAEFAANAADYHHWDPPVRRFVDDCLSGADGPSEQRFEMRWTGSLAAELQRIVIRGGVFLAPHGTRAPLRLIHHCHPAAMLIEQAGGRATDGRARILDTSAATLDATSPLVFGSPGKVARVAAYHDLPDSEASPLFGRRGLFRH